MKLPQIKEERETIAKNFEKKWNFSHRLGALNGKHVVIKAPWSSGLLYHKYKGTFSMVLLALADADLKLIAIDVGAYGRNSDGGIFSNSNLGKGITANTLQFPVSGVLQGAEYLGPMPYVMVADEAFPCRHI